MRQNMLMVKPQFEVRKEQVGKGGVVRDDALREEVSTRVSEAAQALGYVEQGRAESQLHGPKGNREVFVYLLPSG